MLIYLVKDGLLRQYMGSQSPNVLNSISDQGFMVIRSQADLFQWCSGKGYVGVDNHSDYTTSVTINNWPKPEVEDCDDQIDFSEISFDTESDGAVISDFPIEEEQPRFPKHESHGNQVDLQPHLWGRIGVVARPYGLKRFFERTRHLEYKP